jgi:hypothetical protein
MKMTMKLSFVCCLLLMFGAGSSSALPLNADPLALQTGYAQFQAIEGNNQLYGGVSYAVYAKDDYVGHPLPVFSNENYAYVYAYQVDISPFSTADMHTFAIDLPGQGDVYNIGYDPGKAVLYGAWPTQQTVAGNSATWQFDENTLGPGTYSMVLLLTSNFEPGMSDADFIVDGVSGYVGASVAAPVPEPATIALLTIGAAAILRKRSA